MFLTQYEEVNNLDKRKEIKFFSCIGDSAITEEQTEKIAREREEFEQARLDA